MDKDTFKAKLMGGETPVLVDAEWDEGRTGVVTLTFQRPGEAVYKLRVGTLCGDPYPELVPDPEVRRRLHALPDAKKIQVAEAIGFNYEGLSYPQFVTGLLHFAWVNDKSDEVERLVALAEPGGQD